MSGASGNSGGENSAFRKGFFYFDFCLDFSLGQRFSGEEVSRLITCGFFPFSLFLPAALFHFLFFLAICSPHPLFPFLALSLPSFYAFSGLCGVHKLGSKRKLLPWLLFPKSDEKEDQLGLFPCASDLLAPGTSFAEGNRLSSITLTGFLFSAS